MVLMKLLIKHYMKSSMASVLYVEDILKKFQLTEQKTACVDHDHKTGVVRGLLCWNCNVAIGKLDDNPDTVLNAYKYLKGELK